MRPLLALVLVATLGACAGSPTRHGAFGSSEEECLEEQQAGWIPNVSDPNWDIKTAKYTPISEAEKDKLRIEAQWFITEVRNDTRASWSHCCVLVLISERQSGPGYRAVRYLKEDLPGLLKDTGTKDIRSLVGVRFSYIAHKETAYLGLLAAEALECSVTARKWNASRRPWC